MSEPKILKGMKNKKLNGKEFKPEFIVDCLPNVAAQGNFAAMNALNVERYSAKDEPLWYGKVGGLGFVVSEKNFEEKGDE